MDTLYIFTYDLLNGNDQDKQADATAAVSFNGQTLTCYGCSEGDVEWLNSYKLLRELNGRKDDISGAIAHPITGLYSYATQDTGVDAERLFAAIGKRLGKKKTIHLDEIDLPDDLSDEDKKAFEKVRRRFMAM